ncbi:hypothetical protein B0H13DRAFT_2332683 [Mycena leptocephala]|nr:hypothetical protein B0H13DRAFT_2332683 [Mycena leptocephala]
MTDNQPIKLNQLLAIDANFRLSKNQMDGSEPAERPGPSPRREPRTEMGPGVRCDLLEEDSLHWNHEKMKKAIAEGIKRKELTGEISEVVTHA